jgi:hypothetical protein
MILGKRKREISNNLDNYDNENLDKNSKKRKLNDNLTNYTPNFIIVLNKSDDEKSNSDSDNDKSREQEDDEEEYYEDEDEEEYYEDEDEEEYYEDEDEEEYYEEEEDDDSDDSGNSSDESSDDSEQDNNNNKNNNKKNGKKDYKKDNKKDVKKNNNNKNNNKDNNKKDNNKKDNNKKDNNKKDINKKDDKKDSKTPINSNKNNNKKHIDIDIPLYILPPIEFSFPHSHTNKKKPKEKIDESCKNPLCNHKTMKEDPTPINMPNKKKIDNIMDLIELGKTYHCKKNTSFNGINLRLLNNLVVPLTELSNLVGMKSVKEGMVNQILFFLQGFNKGSKCGSCVDCVYNLPCAKNFDDMLHTVITGPPGVGKTELGKILAKVYKEMGILSKGHFKMVSRSDLIGKYLGHTAKLTQKVIDEAQGGVLFIDEAYSLGNAEGRDSFAKECIDTLNQNLTEKRDFLCIIAGYKSALEKCFFNMNEGLQRRFTFKYDIEKYKSNELKQIFLLKVKKSEWKIDFIDNETMEKGEKEKQNKKLDNFFDENRENFPNYGGDMETLLLNCKIIHSKRVVFEDVSKKRLLTFNDIEKGYELYVENRQYKDGLYRNPPSHLFI